MIIALAAFSIMCILLSIKLLKVKNEGGHIGIWIVLFIASCLVAGILLQRTFSLGANEYHEYFNSLPYDPRTSNISSWLILLPIIYTVVSIIIGNLVLWVNPNKMKRNCCSCGNTIIYQVGLKTAEQNKIKNLSDRIVMCEKCKSVFTVRINIYGMTIEQDITNEYKEQS